MSELVTCAWCGKKYDGPHQRCQLIVDHALMLAKEVIKEVPKGGIQLYIAIERTGQPHGLVSVVRWSPLEPLESASSVAKYLTTYPLPSE